MAANLANYAMERKPYQFLNERFNEHDAEWYRKNEKGHCENEKDDLKDEEDECN